jgi:thiol-disulfide isomerase/thioredoxin
VKESSSAPVVPAVHNAPLDQAPPPSKASPPSVAEIIERVDGGVVLVRCRDADGQEIGIGSGFVIDAEGSVATNFHVLRAASSAEAVFVDGTTIPIQGCRAWDADFDLAILELSKLPEKLEVLKVADDATRPAAADVIAIGHPAGFRFTTTTGIISAVHATKDLPQPYRSFISAPDDAVWIQTTAAISGGNSGGPLLSRDGEVIGINTWVASGENLGFAVDARHLDRLRGPLPAESITLQELTEPQGRLQALTAEFQGQRQWLMQQLQQASSVEEARKLVETRHPAIDFMPRIWELAKENPNRPVVFDALVTLCAIAALPDCPTSCDASFKPAVEAICANYAKDRRLAPMLLNLGGSPLDESRHLLRRLGNESGDRTVQGVALLALAVSLQYRPPPDQSGPTEATAALERVVAELADVELESQKLGALAEEMLYECKFLSIGCRPPEISGRDAEGTEFKLSDYAGKVVVVDFWADWCPHCVVMYPLERKLVENYADQPFALLGVNCDEPQRLRRVLESKNVTWRSWADGPTGPIARSWRVESYPTLYVLDHEGVIRYKDVRGEDLEKAVADLMAKAPRPEQASAAPDGEVEPPAPEPADASPPESPSSDPAP